MPAKASLVTLDSFEKDLMNCQRMSWLSLRRRRKGSEYSVGHAWSGLAGHLVDIIFECSGSNDVRFAINSRGSVSP
jgi:hypothetical protein